MVPILETARLRLRSYEARDLDSQAAMLGDTEVVRHLGGRTSTREEVWRKLIGGPGLWALLGYGYWTVERLDDGTVLGQVGFADFKRDLSPSIEGVPEMGWVFGTQAQGQGYAFEAVQAALAWADDALADHSFAAIIAPENQRSIRLAEKGGFSRAHETLYHGDPTLIFRRPAASAERGG